MKHLKLFENFEDLLKKEAFDKINEGKSKIPTVEKMKALFDKVNVDAKANNEIVMPYDHKEAIDFYEDQIRNIYLEDGTESEEEKDKLARELSVKLCEFGAGKPPHIKYSEGKMVEALGTNSFQGVNEAFNWKPFKDNADYSKEDFDGLIDELLDKFQEQLDFAMPLTGSIKKEYLDKTKTYSVKEREEAYDVLMAMFVKRFDKYKKVAGKNTMAQRLDPFKPNLPK